MRSVLNHNLSTISFMQNYLALFEICIVVCCGLFKCIFFFWFRALELVPLVLYPLDCIIVIFPHGWSLILWVFFFRAFALVKFINCICQIRAH